MTKLADPSKLSNFVAWIEALESGEFAQTKQRLRRPDNGSFRYCCLGVATELACRAGVKPIVNRSDADRATCDDDSPEHEHNQWCVTRGSEILPPEVAEWLGLSKRDPEIEIPGDDGHYEDLLSFHNDGGATFAQIAQALRATYLNEPSQES